MPASSFRDEQDAAILRVFEAGLHHFGVTALQVRGPGRHRTLVYPRSMMMYVMRTCISPPPSYLRIGAAFGGRDHSTVFFAVHKVQHMIDDQRPLPLRDLAGMKRLLGIESEASNGLVR